MAVCLVCPTCKTGEFRIKICTDAELGLFYVIECLNCGYEKAIQQGFSLGLEIGGEEVLDDNCCD